METKKVKISGSMLNAAKSAETALRREAAKGLEDGIPEGHPLKLEVERAKAAMGGDLSGLPEGHPLLKALEAAKAGYEAKKAAEEEGRLASPGVKQVKKLDPEKARQDARKVARRQEEEAGDKKKAAASEVNRSIDVLLNGTKELFRVVSENEGALSVDPFSRSKVSRLKRLLFAAERGVSECRISRL